MAKASVCEPTPKPRHTTERRARTAQEYRRCERTTIGELVEDRYGRQLAIIYSVFAISYFVFNQGTMMKGAGKAISVATGGQLISANQVVLAWMVQSDPCVIPLVAASTVEQMRENLGALEIGLSADQMALLNGASA